MWTYSVVLTPDDNETVMAFVPDVPGVHTFGDDEADALARVEDALVTMLTAHIQAREPIPAPRRTRAGSTTVTLPPLVGLKLALYEAMRTAGVGKAELARRLHVHLPQVDRLLDLEHASKLDAVVEALRVMGRDVEVKVRPSKARSAA
jgi:antitoxin HicB